MANTRVHIVVGTRPEAVKMGPLVLALRRLGVVEPVIVATGQHPAMVAQVLDAFGLAADVTLALDRRSGELAELVAQLSPALDEVLHRDGSSGVVVQGDTTSALVGGMVAFWRRLPVIHLEAGLRSGDIAAPFPEEANRRLLSVVADLHLAPTRRAVDALLAEHVPQEKILLVGNTVVDAITAVAAAARPLAEPALAPVGGMVADGARLMLVTAHRRESWGQPLDNVLSAVEQIVEEHDDLLCVLPAHANPAVREQVDARLAGHGRVIVTGPLGYPDLCWLLSRSTLVLSDSGGIQEEAPSFRVPVLVLRDVTERVEAIDGGWAQLVGTDTARIVASAKEILGGDVRLPTGPNPFGDGRAGERSAAAIVSLLGRENRPAR
jgi:UDP-N-acetylglucosamine 2-epimerase (non-hydrolysing)